MPAADAHAGSRRATVAAGSIPQRLVAASRGAGRPGGAAAQAPGPPTPALVDATQRRCIRCQACGRPNMRSQRTPRARPAPCKGLRALLRLIPEVEMIGEAEDGAAAVREAERLQPDLILMDLHMPGMGGLAATEQILRSSPHVGVLMLTMIDEDEALFAAMRVGARGYVLKGADRVELARAIRAVHNGEAIFSPSVAQRLAAAFSRPQATGGPAFPELSEREREVLALIGRGLSNAEIAARLVISGKTVRNHITNIFAKLGVRERSEAIARAREAGLS